LGKRYKARELTLQAMYQYDIGELGADELVLFNWVNKKKLL
jgi:transcription termination factor NusB